MNWFLIGLSIVILSHDSAIGFQRIYKHKSDSFQLYGIPKLFRWLVDLYPIVLESVGDTKNSMTVDNFYLDMNGIIHTCTHSNNDKLVELNENMMFQRIFSYTDQLYKLVRPNKLMLLAVDGVAPRAKMNQQRARRFRSSKEREALLADHVAKEGRLPDADSFDSNCITPGTDFMFKLGIEFRKWIDYKMRTDPIWMNGADVVFSGPEVPGEGEHKIMEYIRTIVEGDPNFKRGTIKHCMYGLDADLIMLSLATHEPYFVLLREKIHRRKSGEDTAKKYSKNDFELLEISLLRKMLQQHFRKMGDKMDENVARYKLSNSLTAATPIPTEEKVNEKASEWEEKTSSAWKRVESSNNNNLETVESSVERHPVATYNLERVIDDFVFMCFFVGNDFLPCVPHLDIADGSLNLMMNVYKNILPDTLGGYLTDKSKVHLPRIELFLQEIARRESLYFQQRALDEKDPKYAGDGYKDHYYREKFGIEPEDKKSKRQLVQSYLEGLVWVLEYYHSGCSSWTWYYPYLYAPLATDLINLADLDLSFVQGKPFTPLLQLLSVLPPQSAPFLPPSYQKAMTDRSSPLYEYYPTDFMVDPNGKKRSWESIVQIPFINETILVDTINQIDHYKELTVTERIRNVPGTMHHFKPPGKSTTEPLISLKKPTGKTRKVQEDSGVGEEGGAQQTRWGDAIKDDATNRVKQMGNNRGMDSKNKSWIRSTPSEKT